MNRTQKVISVVFWQLLEEKPFNKDYGAEHC